MKRVNYSAVAIAAAFCLFVSQASAMTLQEFRKFTTTEQGMYIGAAVNMLAYSYAASGNVAKASCIKKWYFGVQGVETPGPREITIEIEVAGHLDAAKYHVEGVILGVVDKACGSATGN